MRFTPEKSSQDAKATRSRAGTVHSAPLPLIMMVERAENAAIDPYIRVADIDLC